MNRALRRLPPHLGRKLVLRRSLLKRPGRKPVLRRSLPLGLHHNPLPGLHHSLLRDPRHSLLRDPRRRVPRKTKKSGDGLLGSLYLLSSQTLGSALMPGLSK